jgi:hypothetical protein
MASMRSARFASWPARAATRGAAREGRGLPMQRATSGVEFVFEPLDLLPQRVAFAPVPIPISVGAFLFLSQSFDLALLPLELFDQIFARGRAPSREHPSVMARVRRLYKYDFLDMAYG